MKYREKVPVCSGESSPIGSCRRWRRKAYSAEGKTQHRPLGYFETPFPTHQYWYFSVPLVALNAICVPELQQS
eukprot:scaffold823_cov219-Amphora_coffeaeformis.AAC.22